MWTFIFSITISFYSGYLYICKLIKIIIDKNIDFKKVRQNFRMIHTEANCIKDSHSIELRKPSVT